MRISDWSSDVCSSDLNPAIEIDTWLMSCRVLGRGVENAMLSVIASQTARSGATRLIGRYRPTPRNAMVRDLFDRLGFSRRATRENGETDLDPPLDGGPPPAPAHFTVLPQNRQASGRETGGQSGES